MSPADGLQPPAQETIRVMTWNIHGGVGADRRCDLGRILDVLNVVDPDIAALQEVDGRTWLGRSAGAFERLAGALGDHCVEARLTGSGPHAYGHLLWSRWAPKRSTVRRLPGGWIEPRAVIDATIQTPSGEIRVLATHFGLMPADRARQAAFVERLHGAGGTPTIALGDFNDWRRAGGSVQRRIGRALPVLATAETWPARRPFVAMDRIYATADISFSAKAAPPEAKAASDHLPLVVDLKL